MQHKVLVIEDNSFSSALYQNHLTKAGFIVQVASDGRQALELADSFRPQAIILDLIIPKIDGFAIIKLLRSVKPHHQTPIIVVSDLTQKEDIDKCLSCGAQHYFTKSDLDYSRLIETIQKILPHHHSTTLSPRKSVRHILTPNFSNRSNTTLVG